MQDLAEVKVTLMPDGGISCVDGVCSSREGLTVENNNKPLRLPLPSILCRRMGVEANSSKKFGSADCVIDSSWTTSSTPPSPPTLPRRGRRSLPCRAASVHDYTDLHHNRVLIRRQSQPSYVGIARYIPFIGLHSTSSHNNNNNNNN